jgi:hypothetical protein
MFSEVITLERRTVSKLETGPHSIDFTNYEVVGDLSNLQAVNRVAVIEPLRDLLNTPEESAIAGNLIILQFPEEQEEDTKKYWDQ